MIPSTENQSFAAGSSVVKKKVPSGYALASIVFLVPPKLAAKWNIHLLAGLYPEGKVKIGLLVPAAAELFVHFIRPLRSTFPMPSFL